MDDLRREICAADHLLKDRDTLLTFSDFPAEHFVHLRSSNPIEGVISTARHRTLLMKGALLAGHGSPYGVQARDGGVKKLASG